MLEDYQYDTHAQKQAATEARPARARPERPLP
jgi:hypothetical protein